MTVIRPIDRFVGALHREKADELLFETTRPVRLRTGGAERTLLAQPLRADQVESLLHGIVPPDRARALVDIGEASFPYAAPSGTVRIYVHRRDERLTVSVRPYTPPPKTPAPPPKSLQAELAEYVEHQRSMSLDLVSVAPEAPPPEPIVAAHAPADPSPRIAAAVRSAHSIGATTLLLVADQAPRARLRYELAAVPGFDRPMSGAQITAATASLAPPEARASIDAGRDAELVFGLDGVGLVHASIELEGAAVVAKLSWDARVALPDGIDELCAADRGIILISGGRRSARASIIGGIVERMHRLRSIETHCVGRRERSYTAARGFIRARRLAEGEPLERAIAEAARREVDVLALSEALTVPAARRVVDLASAGPLVIATVHAPTPAAAVDWLLGAIERGRDRRARARLADALRGGVSDPGARLWLASAELSERVREGAPLS